MLFKLRQAGKPILGGLVNTVKTGVLACAMV